jgi:hypothetical protein
MAFIFRWSWARSLSNLLLLGHRQHWLGVGILGRLPPTLHLIREESPLPALGAQLGGG